MPLHFIPEPPYSESHLCFIPLVHQELQHFLHIVRPVNITLQCLAFTNYLCAEQDVSAVRLDVQHTMQTVVGKRKGYRAALSRQCFHCVVNKHPFTPRLSFAQASRENLPEMQSVSPLAWLP